MRSLRESDAGVRIAAFIIWSIGVMPVPPEIKAMFVIPSKRFAPHLKEEEADR